MHILKAYLIFLVIMLCATAIISIKNDVTLRHRTEIIKAIRDYQLKCVEYDAHAFVGFEDMEDYGATLYRWWDWTNKRILPKDKFEIIKPFMEGNANDQK